MSEAHQRCAPADVHWGWLNPRRFDGSGMAPITLACSCGRGECRLEYLIDYTPQTPGPQHVPDSLYGEAACRRHPIEMWRRDVY